LLLNESIPGFGRGGRERVQYPGQFTAPGLREAEIRLMTMDIERLKERLEKFERVPLIHRPTPMRKLERISAELGGPEIWIKRDDLTGLAFGGNKSRKLEFIIPDVLAKKRDVVITWAALQSNWAMQTAAACRRYGLLPVLLLFKRYDLPPEPDGNMLLDALLDADIRVLEPTKGKSAPAEDALALAKAAAQEFRARGRNPYVVPVGGSEMMGDLDRPLGALSYVQAYVEMLEQTRALGFDPDAVVLSTGSGSTQAGLLAGARALSPKTRVVGISVSDEKTSFARIVGTIREATDHELGLAPPAASDDILVYDEFIRDGYGIINREVVETIRWVFTREGIVLDPVYTSKAFLGLIELVRRGEFRKSDRIVFFHTGGTPALFPNRGFIAQFLKT